MEINFTGGSYQNRFVDIDDEETINWFVEHVDPPADPKSPKPMMPTPGLLQYVTIPGAPAIIRGFYVTSTGRAFVVYGNTLWEIVVNNKVVSRGTLSTTTGPVSMADNGQNSSGGRGLIIVDGQYGYMFNLSTAVFFRIQSPVQCPNSDNAVPAGCMGVAELITAFGAASVNIYSGDLFELQGTSGQTWTDTVDVVMTTAKDAAPGPGDVYVYYATPIPTIQFIKNYVDTSGNAIWPMSTTPTIAITEGTAGVPLPQSQSVRFMDGFFVLAQGNTGQFFISQPYDGSNWDITQYATAEGTSDVLVGIEVIHDELILFCTTHTEIWYDAGGQQFPFQRIFGALIQVGCVAHQSIARAGDTIFWLGGSTTGHGQVWMLEGMQPQKVSLPSIDHIIESMPNISDAVGFSYTQEGHKFYMLSFQQGNKTLCFDRTTGEWHERAFWNVEKGAFDRHRAQYAGFAFNQNLVTDYSKNIIYSMNVNAMTDNGAIIRRVRCGPQIQHDRKRIFFDEFEIDIQRGQGTVTGQGQNPQAILFWSDDGGETWSNGYPGSLGAMGQYKTRLHWHRLGYSRDRAFKLVLTDPVNTAIIGARADIRIEGMPNGR